MGETRLLFAAGTKESALSCSSWSWAPGSADRVGRDLDLEVSGDSEVVGRPGREERVGLRVLIVEGGPTNWVVVEAVERELEAEEEGSWWFKVRVVTLKVLVGV